jgi:hypothetical protein
LKYCEIVECSCEETKKRKAKIQDGDRENIREDSSTNKPELAALACAIFVLSKNADACGGD